MQIKVFKAETMKEAVAAMRAELGSRAVILHSKKYKESGLLGLRTKDVVEITAAVEDAPNSGDSKQKPAAVAQPANLAAAKYRKNATETKTPPSEAEQKVSEADVKKLQNVLKRVKENSPIEIESQSDAEILNASEEPKKAPKIKPKEEVKKTVPKITKPEQITPTPPEKVETPNPSLPLNLTPEQMQQFQAMMFAQFQKMQNAQNPPPVEKIPEPEPPAKSENISTRPVDSPEQLRIKQLEAEIAQMKIMLAQALGKDSQKPAVTLKEALKRQDVSEDIINEISNTSMDYLDNTAKWELSSYFSEHMRFSEGVKLNRRTPKIVALVGTTGVGKTTTLAKIAAKFVLEQGIGAALITADTYRISAVEQLKTYSDILGLPIDIVYTPQELALAIDSHKDKELILVDTAGRSQYSDAQMRELQEFLKVNPRIEKHLVISASVKLNDAKEIIRKFSVVTPEKIIITKIDETSNLGTVINLLRREKYPLSYITTGQSVPDDIEVGNAETLANVLLKKISTTMIT